MKKLLAIWWWIIFAFTFVCWATDIEWERKTENGSTVRCINVSLDWDQVWQVKIQWEEWGEYEEVFVTTWTEISPVCHEYSSNWKHSATLEVLSWKNENNETVENDFNYVGFLNQEVTDLTKLESKTLDYFVLVDEWSNKLSDEKYDEIIKKIDIPNKAEVHVEKWWITNTTRNSWWSSWKWGWSGSWIKSKTTTSTWDNKKWEISTGVDLKIKEEKDNKKEEKWIFEKKAPSVKTAIIPNNSEYSDEIKSAYIWAYQNDITTINVLDNANPEWELLRGQMAKILVNYAVNVLWKEITSIPSYCSWDDDEERANEEMKSYWRKACALWLMWVNVKSFNPMWKVSRAQFWTALSRLLWWNKNNTTWENYYEKHLNALKWNGYLDNTNSPKERTEKRKWVRVILKRTTK